MNRSTSLLLLPARQGAPESAGWMLELLLLAAVWGIAYLWFRISVRDFGPLPVAWVRLGLAALCLLPGVCWRGEVVHIARHWRAMVLVGACNFALPFAFYAYAMETLNAGLASVVNATAPLFATLIAWAWLREPLTGARVAGLAVGFAGVSWLAWDRLGVPHAAPPGAPSVAVGFVLCMAATVLYGFAASFTRRHLAGVPPSAIAVGSLLASALLLTVPALAQWPRATPPRHAWLPVIGLGVLCTAWAFATYFRLLARIGPSRTIATTYLTPVFGLAWGWLWLDEAVTWPMVGACGVILAGTALGSGAWCRRAS